MNRGFLAVYLHMKHYFLNYCEADEHIGFKKAMKYLHFILKKEILFNEQLENVKLERQIKKQQELIYKLQLKVNDLTEDNKVLTDRFNAIKDFDPINAKIFVNYNEGYTLVETEAWEYPVKLWVAASKEEIEQHLPSAIRQSVCNKRPKNPADYVRQRMVHYYRKKGFIVK